MKVHSAMPEAAIACTVSACEKSLLAQVSLSSNQITRHLVDLCCVVSEVWVLPDQPLVAFEIHSIHLHARSTMSQRKEKKRLYRFNKKPSIISGCPGYVSKLTLVCYVRCITAMSTCLFLVA